MTETGKREREREGECPWARSGAALRGANGQILTSDLTLPANTSGRPRTVVGLFLASTLRRLPQHGSRNTVPATRLRALPETRVTDRPGESFMEMNPFRKQPR